MRFIKLSETDLKSLESGHRHGKHFLFRDRCQCLILSHQGHTISEFTKLFNVHHVTIYEWFNLWESGGSKALHKKSGQGHCPKLSPANPKHVEHARALVEDEMRNLKAVVAKLSAELEIEMHPDTLKRFLKNLPTLSADSANVSKRVRTQISTLKAK